MATEIGTATNAADLWGKLLTFLTTNTTLVGLGEEWVDSWTGDSGNEHVLTGPGTSGTDEIHIGLRLHVDVPADECWIELLGMTGIIPSGEALEDHINVQPKPSLMFIDNSTMNYWFIANGRRFMVVLKISTTFESCYAGFFLPYATPVEYPYPMFVGGTAGPDSGDAQSPRSWREDLLGHSAFPWPYSDQGVNLTTDFVSSGSYSVSPDGTWMAYSNYSDVIEGCIGNVTRGTYISSSGTVESDDDYLSSEILANGLTDLYGGGKYLMPIHLFECSPGRQTYGILQGAFRCQTDFMSAEDTITISTVDYLVVQNVYRNDIDDFFAVGLE
jgi:hypothetical protein